MGKLFFLRNGSRGIDPWVQNAVGGGGRGQGVELVGGGKKRVLGQKRAT